MMSLWLLLNQKKYLTLKILLKTVSFILLLQMTMKIQYNINVRMIKVMNKSNEKKYSTSGEPIQ